ncbi:hypothetical protein [Legionella feeleii]|uniref:UVB-resistance protein UVR8 n=1 Tax=Legionella feeleii TaxID=453 RepID=A0A378IWS8_9GAMM|nr:hypothetical protein [Legionella feeleii]STX39025.1 UVB-resistance protein UVR8 [Legionella feeleii]
MSNPFSLLPEEIHPLYHEYLSYTDIKNLSFTCKFFSQSVITLAELKNRQRTIHKVYAGVDAAYFLFKDGKVMSIGSHLRGQLGIGTSSLSCSALMSNLNKINFPPQIYIEKLVAGYQHVFFRTVCKKWYGCGSNEYGELHSGNTGDSFSPTPVKPLGAVVIQDIVAGKNLSFFKLANGDWYGVGNNSFGQLGTGHTQTSVIPQLISSPGGSRIRNIFTQNNSTILETEEGIYYGCGQNSYGELGLGHTDRQIVPAPIPLSLTHRIIKVIHGFFAHTYFQTDEGWFACGINRTGQLGFNHRTLQLTPTLLKLANNCRITSISPGKAHTVFGDEHGNWYVCGANRHGQISITTKSRFPIFQLNQIFLPNGEKIHTAIVGGIFTILQSVNNSWYSYGEIKITLEHEKSNLPKPFTK